MSRSSFVSSPEKFNSYHRLLPCSSSINSFKFFYNIHRQIKFLHLTFHFYFFTFLASSSDHPPLIVEFSNHYSISLPLHLSFRVLPFLYPLFYRLLHLFLRFQILFLLNGSFQLFIYIKKSKKGLNIDIKRLMFVYQVSVPQISRVVLIIIKRHRR